MLSGIVGSSYTANGTYLGTFAAGSTLAIVDSCDIIDYCDSALGAGLLTLAACNAGIGAELSCYCALLLIMAGNYLTLDIGHHMDKGIGTSLRAYTAADTLSRIHSGNSLIHAYSTLGTYSLAVAATETAVGAHAVAAVEHLCRSAGLHTHISRFLFCGITVTAATHRCHHFHSFLKVCSESIGNSL